METQITVGEEVKELQDQCDGKTIYVDLGITKNEAGKMSLREGVGAVLEPLVQLCDVRGWVCSLVVGVEAPRSISFLKHLYWSIIALQCCVSCCCKTK